MAEVMGSTGMTHIIDPFGAARAKLPRGGTILHSSYFVIFGVPISAFGRKT
jgi:hypothetical protein